eukprot:4426913-Prymnesium_polylepis.1
MEREGAPRAGPRRRLPLVDGGRVVDCRDAEGDRPSGTWAGVGGAGGGAPAAHRICLRDLPSAAPPAPRAESRGAAGRTPAGRASDGSIGGASGGRGEVQVVIRAGRGR